VTKNILVVEDSISQAEKLKLVLEINNYSCVVARNGKEALEHLSGARTFDAVLSDVVMPRMTGYELCRIIKDRPESVALPVLLMTSTTAPHEIIQCISSCADAFLGKPYQPETLISRLRFLLREPDSDEPENSLTSGLDLLESAKAGNSVFQLTNLLVTTLEDVSRNNAELNKNRIELQDAQSKLVDYAKLVEQELGTTRKQLNVRNLAIETLEQALLIISAESKNYTIADANSAIEVVTGYKPSDLIGKPPPIFTDNIENYMRFLDLLASAKNSKIKKSARDTLKIIHKDGSDRWCDFRISFISEKDSDQAIFACALSDISSEYSIRMATEYLSQRTTTDDNYFSEIVKEICRILNVGVAFICESTDETASAIAFYEFGKSVENFTYSMVGTPCEVVTENGECQILKNAKEQFPDDEYFQENRIESYMGMQIFNPDGASIGFLGIMRRMPISNPDSFSKVLKIFSIAIGAEMERARARKQYEELFRFAPEAMLMVGRNGKILLINQRAEKMFGYNPEQLVGQWFGKLIPPDNLAEQRSWIDEYAKNPLQSKVVLGNIELKGITRKGKVFPVQINLNPLRTNGGETIVVGIQDMTVRLKQDEDRLARRAAEEANKAKSAFLATMSHEIRTPLNGVLGSSELLTRMPLGDEQYELVQTINESGTTLLQVIDEILDFSKIEAGKITVEKELINLASICESVCRALIPVAFQKEVKLSLYIDSSLPEKIVSDGVRLRQILNNLISNAMKFSSSGGEGKVRVRIERGQDENVSISVSDNGIGISEEYQRKLFKPFTQAEASTTWRFGGTGLGLTICKRLTELMGGEIAVFSKLGVGTRFTVSLPIGKTDETVPAVNKIYLENLLCLIVSEDLAEAEDWRSYLVEAGASVQYFASLKAAESAISQLNLQKVVVLSCIEQEASKKWFTNLRLSENASLLVLRRTAHHKSLKLIAPSLLLLQYNLMLRSKLLTAVATAAGFESLPVVAIDTIENVDLELQVPSREKAIENGQLILVTEDNVVNQTVIQRQLAMLGYQADLASDGKQGLKAWQSGDYALLLTDLHMPEMDGYELTRVIRKAGDKFSDRPIIALTANALKGEKEKCLKIGMDDYLSKPITLQNLKEKIEPWLPVGGRVDVASEEGGGSKVSAGKNTKADSKPNLLDLGELKKLIGDDDAIINRLCGEFNSTLTVDRDRIKAAYANKQLSEVSELAHRVKSSARMFGAFAFGDCCEKIEKYGKSRAEGLDERLLDEFDAFAGQVLTELSQYK